MESRTALEPEQGLIVRCRQGDRKAFDILVLSLLRGTYFFCLRLTGDPEEAEELSQRGFVSMYRNIAQYRGQGTFRRWFSTILINQYRSMYRARSRERKRLLSLQREAVETGEAPAVEVDDDVHARVRREVDRLPPRQREVLLLHFFQDLSYAEIAEALECRYNDVKTNLSLARRKLKDRLNDVWS